MSISHSDPWIILLVYVLNSLNTCRIEIVYTDTVCDANDMQYETIKCNDISYKWSELKATLQFSWKMLNQFQEN